MDDFKENEEQRLDLSHLLEPLKNITFSEVIRNLAQKDVIPIDMRSNEDLALIDTLNKAAQSVLNETISNPIINKRVNEVGNKIEAYVERAVKEHNCNCFKPRGRQGKKNPNGYPDFELLDQAERVSYLEVKTFSKETKYKTQRTFYLSPSNNFKVTKDARHLLLAFQMVPSPNSDPKMLEYRAVEFLLIDVSTLMCDVKNEFQSNNKRMYEDCLVLAEGKV